MNYVKIDKFDIANGVDVGCVLWVSGCEHHCPHCHNPQTWDFNTGQEFDQDTLNELLESLKRPYIKRLTFSGGDPLHPCNLLMVKAVAEMVKKEIPGIDIWCYTGYNYREVSGHLKDIDVLVDGRYIHEERDVTLPFRGSRNQRVIDVKKSREVGEVVLYDFIK